MVEGSPSQPLQQSLKDFGTGLQEFFPAAYRFSSIQETR
ncbi:Uncharacterised protein [Proteus mirabilis]|uniref:Uncharacterized protein n=1 Tax=Proteus mirabilis TaxID=584 RepID=A0A379FER5_PROMI|nr:Uncharacterised protein [Proteus mirabilis]